MVGGVELPNHVRFRDIVRVFLFQFVSGMTLFPASTDVRDFHPDQADVVSELVVHGEGANGFQ